MIGPEVKVVTHLQMLHMWHGRLGGEGGGGGEYYQAR